MGKAKSLELIATDGVQTARLIWFRIGSDGGIYGSFFHKNIAIHRSYHSDGVVHWKADKPMEKVINVEEVFKESGYSGEVDCAPPLGSFKGYFNFLQGGFRLDVDLFQQGVSYEFGSVDRLLIIDSRTIKGEQRHLNFYLDLIESGSYEILNERMEGYQKTLTNAGMICEHHCYLEFEPWLLVSLAYSTR